MHTALSATCRYQQTRAADVDPRLQDGYGMRRRQDAHSLHLRSIPSSMLNTVSLRVLIDRKRTRAAIHGLWWIAPCIADGITRPQSCPPPLRRAAGGGQDSPPKCPSTRARSLRGTSPPCRGTYRTSPARHRKIVRLRGKCFDNPRDALQRCENIPNVSRTVRSTHVYCL